MNGIPAAAAAPGVGGVAALAPATPTFVPAPFVATVYFNPQYAYPNDQAIKDAIRKQM